MIYVVCYLHSKLTHSLEFKCGDVFIVLIFVHFIGLVYLRNSEDNFFSRLTRDQRIS